MHIASGDKGGETTARHKHYDYGQMKLVPVSFAQQILPGTFERTLPSNASKEWSGTLADFEKKALKLEQALEKLLARHRHCTRWAATERGIDGVSV